MRAVALIFILAALALASPDARSQMTMTGIGPGAAGGVAITGACPNQLVLVYSNSCALIGQGFGQ
jgi:hypothetical protein